MKSPTHAVRIAAFKNSSVLSKGQKTFNKLIKKIEQERKQLEEWQSTLSLYQQKYSGEFSPLLQAFNNVRADIVRKMDTLFKEKNFSKQDKKKMTHLICSVSASLMTERDEYNLKEIYNKYSDSDFDADYAEEKDEFKAMMEAMLGIELDDDVDFNSPETVMQNLIKKKQQQEEQEEMQEATQRHAPSRKKSAKTLAREEKQKEEAQDISQSIREVYRKLASALHPDREQDEAEKNRKTALMQRVNSAYANKNLLALLELQLEVEQIDQATINAMSQDKLTHYNKILKEQCAEIEQEIDMIRFAFSMRFNISSYALASPKTAMENLLLDINEIKQNIANAKEDLMAFQDTASFKNWLKSYKIPQHINPFGTDLFDDECFEDEERMYY